MPDVDMTMWLPMWSVTLSAGMMKALLIDKHILNGSADGAFLHDACMHIGGGVAVLIAVLFVMISNESDLEHQTRQLILHSSPHID